MRKLAFLCLSLLLIGGVFTACDNTKTYAEMLDDERNDISRYIRDNGITIISVDEFEKDTVTDVLKNEYVGFSNGLYMQIVKRYDDKLYASLEDAPQFENNNLILSRFVEVYIADNDTTAASNVCNPYPYLNLYPDGFRYTDNGYTKYGQFVAEPGLAYYFNYGMAYWYESSVVPSGWLQSLTYIRDGAHVRLIVPSKIGHNTAQSQVYPYFYDIRKFSIY